MMALRHAVYMMNRHLLNLWRQPIWIAVTLVQPVIWLLLYGALFKSVVKIPGFHSRSYIQFLAPGIVVMTALFSSGWSGMPVIDDIDKGIIDRFLVTPAVRRSLILGRLLSGTVIIVVQSLIIVLLALLVGARASRTRSASPSSSRSHRCSPRGSGRCRTRRAPRKTVIE